MGEEIFLFTPVIHEEPFERNEVLGAEYVGVRARAYGRDEVIAVLVLHEEAVLDEALLYAELFRQGFPERVVLAPVPGRVRGRRAVLEPLVERNVAPPVVVTLARLFEGLVCHEHA